MGSGTIRLQHRMKAELRNNKWTRGGRLCFNGVRELAHVTERVMAGAMITHGVVDVGTFSRLCIVPRGML